MQIFDYTKKNLTDSYRSGPSAGFWKGGCGGGSGRGFWISVPTGGSRISGYRGGIEKVSQSETRREHFWGILCEKSRFYAKNHTFSNFRGGYWVRPPSLNPPLVPVVTTIVRRCY